MPHAVILGTLTPAEALEALGERTDRSAGSVLRTTHAWLAPDGSSALVEGVVVEGKQPTKLLALLQKRDDGLVVRLSPFLDEVPRTPGVHRFVAWLARRILDDGQGRTLGPTNLEQLVAEAA
jgi:hypothetical protein